MKKIRNLKYLFLIVSIAVGSSFVYLSFLRNQTLLGFVALMFLVLMVVLFVISEKSLSADIKAIERQFNESNYDILNNCDIGLLVYDENHIITHMSNLFTQRHIDHVDEKLLLWLPELQGLLSGDSKREEVVINDDKYLITKAADASVLIFKDITREYDLDEKLSQDALVLGYVSVDNYSESLMSEDDVNFFNSSVKSIIFNYFKGFGVVIRTLRNSQMQLVLDVRKFEMLRKDGFAILRAVKKEARKGDLDITLSISFAYGFEDMVEMDTVASELLEIASTRGGDQVAIREAGKQAIFYGGSSEAKEKQSKIKVRVTANTLKRLIVDSSKVIVCGHKDADADCVGASLVMSSIASGLNKPAYLILKSGGVDMMIQEVVDSYSDSILSRHRFISEDEALDLYDENTLVIMVDHHSALQSNGANLLRKAKKVVIVDHHRRKADLDVNAMLMYVEAGASSATELALEFIPYISRKVFIGKEEANIMFLGIMIDTNRFRVRAGARTFDVCRVLRQYGADPTVCDELAKEPYDRVSLRTQIFGSARKYRDRVLIAVMEEGEYPRSIISQACDQMIQVKGIDAGFVVGKTNDVLLISARSNGKVNVQTILEKMNGGGHMTAAGLQRKEGSVAELASELRAHIDEYYNEREGVDHESDSVE